MPVITTDAMKAMTYFCYGRQRVSQGLVEEEQSIVNRLTSAEERK